MGKTTFALVCVALMVALGQSAHAQSTTGYQPGFHQALRWTEHYGSAFTWRLKVPVYRAGSKLKLSFRAGDGSMQLFAVNVARVGSNGALNGTPVPVKFNGATGATLSSRQRITSDPVAFTVAQGEELYVSFEAQGELATSAILALPGSYGWSGKNSGATAPPSTAAWYRAIGLMTIDVEGPMNRAFVTIGDSITEGYVDGNTWTYEGRNDDYRNAWSAVASRRSGLPFNNAGVSGQGIYDGLAKLDAEVKVLSGITDCVMLIGTNDITGYPPEQIETKLGEMATQLTGFCRVWLGTLIPKEQTTEVAQARAHINNWIRSNTSVAGYVDFEKVLADGTDVDHFATGMNADAVHPSILGQRTMGEYAGDFFKDPQLTAISPDMGKAQGGETLQLTGSGFRSGVKVSLGGSDATITSWSSTKIVVTAPAHASGSVAVVVRNKDGSSVTKNDGYRYIADGPLITGCAPAKLPATVGGNVTLSGDGFAAGSTVTFDGAQLTPASAATNSIVVALPPGTPGAKSITVTNTDGQTVTSSSCVTFTAPPSLLSVTPDAVAAGTAAQLTLTGADFDEGATVDVGNMQVNVASRTSTTLVVDLPAMQNGSYEVAVTNSDSQRAVWAQQLRVAAVDGPVDEVPAEEQPEATGTTGPKTGCGVVGGGPLLVLALVTVLRRRRPTS